MAQIATTIFPQRPQPCPEARRIEREGFDKLKIKFLKERYRFVIRLEIDDQTCAVEVAALLDGGLICEKRYSQANDDYWFLGLNDLNAATLLRIKYDGVAL